MRSEASSEGGHAKLVLFGSFTNDASLTSKRNATGILRVSYNGHYVTFPRSRRGFDSPHPHHEKFASLISWRRHVAKCREVKSTLNLREFFVSRAMICLQIILRGHHPKLSRLVRSFITSSFVQRPLLGPEDLFAVPAPPGSLRAWRQIQTNYVWRITW